MIPAISRRETGGAPKKYLVTGGAGFIGSCFVLGAVSRGTATLTLDKLCYSGNLLNLLSLKDNPLHRFERGDIGDFSFILSLLEDFRPDALINFAAESHVDRSILAPEDFVRTNVLGTHSLLAAVLAWWKKLPAGAAEKFRFLHVSTDEVFGSLRAGEPAFTESTPYAPNSPYSASKAASDHFARAYHATYGLPVLITNCSNNYGPRQFPEKLIPLVIARAMRRESLPLYGNGENIRDWLHVEDHCAAIKLVLNRGTPGETYNVGGQAERRNIDVVRTVCSALDELRPHPDGPYAGLIRFVADRAGHDFRYAVNSAKIERELGWKRKFGFEQGLRETVLWYLENPDWLAAVQSGAYRDWIRKNYPDPEAVS
ncbi:MAG: dTDP-glucose 4,6-dehydratase [Deltaproteobacteria bacterium]|jgi:dTDP-glucose 4,6-dehydratase|nr:dTDP-glucose 4,6-dehydratase [Deltaproteobacteria bacterium]